MQNLGKIGRSAAELLRMFDFQTGGRPPSWIWYDVISDHPRLVFDGPNILLKLHIDRIYTVQDIAIFIFCRFGLKLPIHDPFGGVLEDITPEWIPIFSQSPNGPSVGENSGSTWRRVREKIQYNQPTIKSHESVIFHLFGEKPPLNGLKWKFCTSVYLPEVIMDVKFKFEKFRDLDVIGVKIRPFPLTLHVGRYHCAALSRCLWYAQSWDN